MVSSILIRFKEGLAKVFQTMVPDKRCSSSKHPLDICIVENIYPPSPSWTWDSLKHSAYQQC
jgi:hypothetical protein